MTWQDDVISFVRNKKPVKFCLFCAIMSTVLTESFGKVNKNTKKKMKPEPVEAKKPRYVSEFMKRDTPEKKKYVYYVIDTHLELNEIDAAVARIEAMGFSKEMITSFRYEKVSRKTWQPDGSYAFVPRWHTEIRVRTEPGFDIADFALKCFDKSHVEPMNFE